VQGSLPARNSDLSLILLSVLILCTFYPVVAAVEWANVALGWNSVTNE
jgi:hypothetical protein